MSRNRKNVNVETISRALRNHFFHTSREILPFSGCRRRFLDVLRCVPRCACALRCVSRPPKLIKNRSRALPVREKKDRCTSQNVNSPGRLLFRPPKTYQKYHFCNTSNEISPFSFQYLLSTPLWRPPLVAPPHAEPRKAHFLVRTLYANRSVLDPRFFPRIRSTRMGGLRACRLDIQRVPRRDI